MPGLAAAGTLGITKTFRRECPKTSVKTIDCDLTMDPNVLATSIFQELLTGDDNEEIGLSAAGRIRLGLRRDEPAADAPLALTRESVVLVTGGAYGVTADVALGLARAYQPKLILVGRSPLPPAESSETASMNAGQLRQHLIARARTEGKKILPADIERSVARTLRNRAILQSIAQFQSAGSQVEYHALDVRDDVAFSKLIADLYQRFGSIAGVIHGAGVIDDKRIRDKSTESFTNVFGTKVDSALTLARTLKPESLAFMVFFSSVSGRFGNAGQADYSAANEFLNKLADQLDARWPGRISSINWGPWDGGMVSDELRRMYAQVGFQLIPVPEGVDHFLAEIRRDHRSSSEIVVSGSVAQMAGPMMIL
jgi:NAD(P)-dependent dehydrogenase (short-subunit alcohol dehydrogenase family)